MSKLHGVVRPWIKNAAQKPLVRKAARISAHHGVLSDRIWKRLPVEHTFRVDLGGGVGFQYISTAGDSIGRSLYWKGISNGWETETLRVFQMLAAHADVILDIGANTGVYSLVASAVNPLAEVVAFEPVPKIHEILVQQIALNGWQDRVEARNFAVSDYDGVATFHIPDSELPTSASLNPEGFRNAKGTLAEVQVTTVDGCCADAVTRVDLVKIDVEGFEDKVLKGMQRTLAESAPTVIVECNPDGPLADIERILKSHGYTFFHLQQEGLVPAETIEPDDGQEHRNYLAVARESVLEQILQRDIGSAWKVQA